MFSFLYFLKLLYIVKIVIHRRSVELFLWIPFFYVFLPNFLTAGFPSPPAQWSSVSDEELRALEGAERENVVARLQWLRDIQALLDGAMMLISQYNTVAFTMGSADF